MPEVEVLRELAGFEPHEGLGKLGEEEGDYFLSFHRGQWGTGDSGDDDVEKVFLTFELVAELAHRPTEVVGF